MKFKIKLILMHKIYEAYGKLTKIGVKIVI